MIATVIGAVLELVVVAAATVALYLAAGSGL